jgi:hypothetical protein
MTAALSATQDHAALLARLWTRATSQAAEAPIRCAVCGAQHERDALLRIITPRRDRGAELAGRDLETVEALIDQRGRGGAFCVHRLEDPEGAGLVIVDADCGCGIGGAA